jgi:hypothetical protein
MLSATVAHVAERSIIHIQSGELPNSGVLKRCDTATALNKTYIYTSPPPPVFRSTRSAVLHNAEGPYQAVW